MNEAASTGEGSVLSLVRPPGPGMFRSATSPQLVLVPRMTQVCKECGCPCAGCLNNRKPAMDPSLRQSKSSPNFATSSKHHSPPVQSSGPSSFTSSTSSLAQMTSSLIPMTSSPTHMTSSQTSTTFSMTSQSQSSLRPTTPSLTPTTTMTSNSTPVTLTPNTATSSLTSICPTFSLDLHHEIEDLRSKLLKSSEQILQMEREFVDSSSYSEQEVSKLHDDLAKFRDRYDRLYESHKKLQKLNHNLEDKLLSIVQKFESEKQAIEAEFQQSKSELLDAKVTICQLEEDCERYRNDCNTAVQLLQCKPSNFVAHKLDVLPVDLQQRLRGHLSKEQQLALEGPPDDDGPKMIKVPMPTFPPTAMVYSVNKSQHPPPPPPQSARIDTVPMSLIAKVLTQPEAKYRPQRLYICTKCKTDCFLRDKETQTLAVDNGFRTAVANMRTNPPTITPHYPPGVHRPRTNSTETEIM